MKLVAFVSRDAADFYLLEFELPALSPGPCRLDIAAEDTATGAIVSAVSRVSIR